MTWLRTWRFMSVGWILLRWPMPGFPLEYAFLFLPDESAECQTNRVLLLGKPRLQPWPLDAIKVTGALAPGVCLLVPAKKLDAPHNDSQTRDIPRLQKL